MIRNDPIVARNFYLSFPGSTQIVLQSVSALNVELTPVSTTQNGARGRTQHIKTVGANTNVPEVEMVRMAPRDAGGDAIWKWYKKIHSGGFKNRTDNRQTLTLTLYDPGANPVAEFNMHGAWPYKIVTDALSTDSNEAMKETITFVCEWIERKK
jgi:phage tail-like protein